MTIEEERKELSEEAFWIGIIRRNWILVLILIAACVGALIGGIFVLLTFIESSNVGNYGTWTFADFSVGTAILWMLLVFLWEFLLVLLPFCGFCGLIVCVFWFKIVSEEDKEAIKSRNKEEKDNKHHHYNKEGGGIGGFLFIAFLLMVFIDGQWLTPFGSLPYNYFVIAWLWGFIWTMIIIGSPAGVIALIYFWRKFK